MAFSYISVKQKNDFAKPRPLTTSKIELFVTIVDSWKLLTFVIGSLNGPLLNYDFRKIAKGCPNVASLVYGDGERPLFVFVPNPKCNRDFNQTIKNS